MSLRGKAPIGDVEKLDDLLLHELQKLYSEIDADTAPYKSSCRACGACCRFQSFGHELWLTDIELAHLLSRERPEGPSEVGACPFLCRNQCAARERRAVSCRVFFCEVDAAIIESLGEKQMARLRALAARCGVSDLRYGELLASMDWISGAGLTAAESR